MKVDNIYIPREIKQKETIVFHIPIIKSPVTTRQIYYFMFGVLVDIPFVVICKYMILDIIDLQDKLLELLIIGMISIAIPAFFSVIALMKKDGRYLEEIFLKRMFYKRSSKIILNERALARYTR